MRARHWTCLLLGLPLLGCGGNPRLQSVGEFSNPAAPIEATCEAGGGAVPLVLSRHVLVSDSEGNLPDERHGGSFSVAFRAIMSGYAEAVARNPDPSRPPRLLFYFNGGLNSQRVVEAQARRQVPCMIADGYYPVFFVWDTDGAASYLQQATSIRDGWLDRSASARARTPLALARDLVSGLAAAPLDYLTHGRRFRRALRREPFCSMVVRDNDGRNGSHGCPSEQQVTFVDEVGGAISRDANVVAPTDVDAAQLEVGRFLSYTALFPARLVSTPLAHGWGDTAWENMLRRTRTTIRQPVEFDLDRHADDGDGRIDGPNKCPKDFAEKQRDFPKGMGIFARFFETMVRYRDGRGLPVSKWSCTATGEVREGRPAPEEAARDARTDRAIADALGGAGITLIGHSMGAIVINELVERFASLPYGEIVVMASAASLRDTRRVMDRHLDSEAARRHDTRFHSLMLHPLNDARERQYAGAVPSGSLLMWIDEMYDPPKTPEDRVFGYWPTAKAARRMFGSAAQDRTLYRVFSRPQASKGKPSNPTEHGQFNEDDTCFWRPNFWGVVGTSWEARHREAFPAHTFARCGERHEGPQRM